MNNPVRYLDPSGLQEDEPGQAYVEPTLLEFLLVDQPSWFDEGWQQEFRAAHHGDEPTLADYLDRYFGMAEASGMGDEASLSAMLREVTHDPSPTFDWPRPPDFYAFTVGAGYVAGGTGQVVVDKYGQVYGGGGGEAGYPPGVSYSVAPGWLLQASAPNEKDLYDFLTKWTHSVGGGYIVGGSVIYSPEGTSTKMAAQVGYYSPQVGYNPVFSWYLGRINVPGK